MFAFLGSLGHCIGMCGGFVMAYSAKIDTSNTSLFQFFAHLSYNLGRISSYTFLGCFLEHSGVFLRSLHNLMVIFILLLDF